METSLKIPLFHPTILLFYMFNNHIVIYILHKINLARNME